MRIARIKWEKSTSKTVLYAARIKFYRQRDDEFDHEYSQSRYQNVLQVWRAVSNWEVFRDFIAQHDGLIRTRWGTLGVKWYHHYD